MALYKLELTPHKSIDFLSIIRPFRKTLGLDNIKLKTVEKYFAYDREDPFTGKELIDLYGRWLETKEKPLFKTLLLHNYEDLLGLAKVLSQMNLFKALGDLKQGLIDIKLVTSSLENGKYIGTFALNQSLENNLVMANDLVIKNELFGLDIQNGIATVTVTCIADTLKLFLEPTSDYYYLPNEDYAVHKSIGKFVNKDHRIKATRSNCYIKKEDFFLPGYRHFELPIHLYYHDSKEALGHYSVSDLVETSLFERYIVKLLSLI